MPALMRSPRATGPLWKPWFMLLLAVVVTATPALPVRAEDAIARILEVQGLVEVRQKGTPTWAKAVEGMALRSGDTVRTQGQSQATLRRPDGTTLELYPLSEATVEDEKAIMLLLGKIWSQFQKAIGRPHEIKTPSSVALIRGTVLSVEAESTGASQVAVVEGLVEVVDRHGQQREMVGAGFAVRADREGRLARLERARPETLQEGRGFMERLERRGPIRSLDEAPGRERENRGPRGDERGGRPEPGERKGMGVERGEQKLRMELRLERGVGERLDRLIDRTQRDERREQAEQQRTTRSEQRKEGPVPVDPVQREPVVERLRERLDRKR